MGDSLELAEEVVLREGEGYECGEDLLGEGVVE